MNRFLALICLLLLTLPASASEMPVAMWQDGIEAAFLTPLPEPSNVQCDIETSCPQTLLVKKLGPRVQFRGQTYDVSRPGLYRFMVPRESYFRTIIHYPEIE